MRALVTGANGFLGRHVVAELVRRGHTVRAMVRPATNVSRLPWKAPSVEVFRADLRTHPDLSAAFAGVDVLIHLAATVVGGEDQQLAETVVGTTRLLRAMEQSQTRRLVLASSFSVYDFDRARGTLTEETPVESKVYQRDGYAVAKLWQERIVRRAAEAGGWQLTVLRPGFIWGAGNEYLAGIGQSAGPVHLVFGGFTRLPLTHVENCAHCFAEAAEHPAAVGETFNVVDDAGVSNWKYMGHYLRGSGTRGARVVIPYGVCLFITHLAQWTSRLLFRGQGKLPSILIPIRFKARFKPLRYSNQKLRDRLGWRPPLRWEECVDRTWPARAAAARIAGAAPAVVPPSLEPARVMGEGQLG